ncbi:hypothetical protein PACTADRAFT_470 [Pachysolen tannophilus NRRL Y-2460]|uniref:Uncharacterized protein n=1 Tax=Pachysolen tannophilus NRRL Y-2460 TaxID=669874 RepID=A0A1E4U253_PACTA|nr:hypothetical protein PACTADRAFT_470 [Pachysolen tannophilus NRRL Y-2460]
MSGGAMSENGNLKSEDDRLNVKFLYIVKYLLSSKNGRRRQLQPKTLKKVIHSVFYINLISGNNNREKRVIRPTVAAPGSNFGRFVANYSRLESTAIEVLEVVISILENFLFLIRFINVKKISNKKLNYLNGLVLKLSKIWLILTIKSSIWRYWRLFKLERKLNVLDRVNEEIVNLIIKAKNYVLINSGLCIIEIMELLEIDQLSWLVNLYNIYRMIGNGSIFLEEEDELKIEKLFTKYQV